MTRPRAACSPRHPSCWPAHRVLVDAYRAARHADELAMESATAMYPAEVAAYKAEHPLITFRRWLIDSAQPRRVAP